MATLLTQAQLLAIIDRLESNCPWYREYSVDFSANDAGVITKLQIKKTYSHVVLIPIAVLSFGLGYYFFGGQVITSVASLLKEAIQVLGSPAVIAILGPASIMPRMLRN